MDKRKYIRYFMVLIGLLFSLSFFNPSTVLAEENDYTIPGINIQVNTGEDGQGTVTTLQLIFLITIISLAPSILLMMTCFTRIIISLHFLRSGIGTQQMPPNQILIGIALFLTFFLMTPTLQKVNDTAIKPLTEGTITQEEAFKNAMVPFREYMFSQVSDADVALFVNIAGLEPYASEAEAIEKLPSSVLIPAYILTELKQGFIIGFLIYIPFIVIDMIVASVLMAMGMMMLPPSMISLPFKILFFVMVDGWNLFLQNLILTFR